MTGEEKREARSKRLTPLRTIRAYCLHCTGGSPQDVTACDANDPKFHVCIFHPYRLGKGRVSARTIRKFCLQCMGDYADFVRDCETRDCICYPYRLGKNPAMKERKGATGEWMRSIHPKKAAFIPKSPGKFERSPLAPTPTLPKGEMKNLSAESAVSQVLPPRENSPGIKTGKGGYEQ